MARPYFDAHARCAGCDGRLAADPVPYSWQDHGYCSPVCALKDPGGLMLQGLPAIVMAEWSGRQGGPGFERDVVRGWLKAATPAAPAMLRRLSGEADLGPAHAGSWSWRLYSGGACRAQRLTRKAAAGALGANVQKPA